MEEATWQVVVLIPEGGGYYRGIGIVEVVWKAVAVILDLCFTSYITYHKSLHGFRAGCSTGTSTLKVKLIKQVMSMRDEVLHAIFLELQKAYNALDRYRCLDILKGYDVRPRALRLLCRYW